MAMPIKKFEAATRQLEAAIDLYFARGDKVAIVTLATIADNSLGDLLEALGPSPGLDPALPAVSLAYGALIRSRASADTGDAAGSESPPAAGEDPGLDVTPAAVARILARAVGKFALFDGNVTPAMVRLYAHLKSGEPAP